MRIRLLGSVALITALFAVGCGDDGGGTAEETGPSTTLAAATTTTLAPVKGGTLTIAQYSSPAGLDPTVVSRGSGTVGGVELAAIYDTVVQFDAQTKTYVPRTGALTANADATVWTLKLKPNIKFSDGTPYDAAAVKANIDRHIAPTSRSGSKAILTAFLETTTVVDPLTVEFKLKQSWGGLPVLFSADVGMIVSPAAVQKAGANFNTTPGDAGAGPFVIASYKPGEELLLRRNDAYWGGAPFLDAVRFVLVGKGDPALMYDSLKVNTVQAFLTRNPQVVSDAKTNKLVAVDSIVPAGNLLNMNVGVVVCKGGLPAGACAGKADGERSVLKTATSDIKVRRAVAAAVDPNVVNARMYDGQGLPGTEVFPKPYPWYPNVPGAKYDVAEAKRLVTEAKTAGWDGKIRVLSSSTPTSSAEGLAVTAMLQAAGMEVQYQNDKDTAGVVAQVITARDFDIVVNWAIGTDFNADNTFASLFNTFYKDTLRYGYGSPDMDAGLDALRVATTDDQRTAAFKKIAEVWVRDQPAAVVAAVPSSWITTAKVHGLIANSSDVVLLDKAWLQP